MHECTGVYGCLLVEFHKIESGVIFGVLFIPLVFMRGSPLHILPILLSNQQAHFGSLHLLTFLNLFKSLCLSCLMYDAEIWMISKCEVVMLESMYIVRFLGLSKDCQLAVLPLLSWHF